MGLSSIVATALVGVTEATGGIHTYDSTGRNGINRTTTPSAFGSGGIIKPCILIKERDTLPTLDLVGTAMSARTIVEIWLYDHNTYATIETMRGKVFSALHNAQLDGTLQVLWAGDVRGARDDTIDALVERSDFAVYQVKRVT